MTNKILTICACLCAGAILVMGQSQMPWPGAAFGEPSRVECADTLDTLLDLQRQACKNPADNPALRSLCALPLAHCFRCAAGSAEQEHQPHHHAQATEKGTAGVYATHSMMIPAGQEHNMHETQRVRSVEISAGQVTAKGADVISHADPVPIPERKPEPNSNTTPELKYETSDNNPLL